MNESFIGFGAGQRDCIGRVLAIKDIFKMLGFLLQNYDLRINEKNVNQILENGISRNGSMNPVMFIEPHVRFNSKGVIFQ